MPPTGPEPEVDSRFSVLLRRRTWAVVCKSGNIPCHASGRYRRNTLETLLRERAGFPEVHFASRLDRETSGCVLVATDVATAGVLGKALMARRVSKTYFCVGRGDWPLSADSDGWCRARGWIRPAGDEVVRKYRVFVPEGPGRNPETGWQDAETRFRVLDWTRFGVDTNVAEVLSAKRLVPLECCPITGRTHQIRATVRALGLEVVGDKLYGPDRSIYCRLCEGAMTEADQTALGIGRQALHAWRVGLRDPEMGVDVCCEAPPDELVALIERGFAHLPPASRASMLPRR